MYFCFLLLHGKKYIGYIIVYVEIMGDILGAIREEGTLDILRESKKNLIKDFRSNINKERHNL